MKYISEKIMNTKNKKSVVTLLICIISLLVLLGVSYAAFYYFFDGENSVFEVQPAELELLESDKNVINIENSLPISDEEGIKQSETFDFAVTTKAGEGKDIEYSLYVEKIGEKCSTLDAPTRDEYPECYDFNISSEDRDILIEYLESWGYNTEEATTYYELQAAGDKDGLINFYMTVDGATAEEANIWVSYAEDDGYILYIIDSYNTDMGTTLDVYDFNEENVIPSYPNFLDDEDVKIYLTDYEDNPLVGPINVSDLSDYRLFFDVNSHDQTNRVQDKYKIRIWIDEEVDVSDWSEETNLEFKFKLGLKASEYSIPDECFEVTEDGVITHYYCAQSSSMPLSSSNSDYEVMPLAETTQNIELPLITDVKIPNKFTLSTGEIIEVKEIGPNAFHEKQLTNLVIPEGITIIGASAFEYCGINSVIIPKSVTMIGSGSFSWNKLRSINIPESVNEIGDSAFDNNDLVSVKISNGVTSIGKRAFSYNSLKSIEIPESVTIIKSSAFSSNGLKKVTFSNGLTTIGSSAFSWNELTSVVIPNSVVTVGNNAFVYNKLKTVQIGTSIESRIMENTGIGKNSFGKNRSSKENLTKIINKSGKALAFENALFGNDSTSYISSGTIVNNEYGNVEVTLE